MIIPELDAPSVTGSYDSIKHILIIKYAGHLKPETTQHAYGWMIRLFEEGHVELSCVEGAIFDFQKVVHFGEPTAAQKESAALNQKFDLSKIPAALVVANEFQRSHLEASVKASPQPERKCIVNSLGEAMVFINQFRTALTQNVASIDTPRVSSTFDTTSRLILVTYYDTLSSEVTTEVYAWINNLIEGYGVETVRGAIFDFRLVTKFPPDNMRTVQRTSSTLNVKYDMSHIPVALLVRDFQQEQQVRLTTRITPQETRKRIVHSPDEAHAFIQEFHQSRKP